MPEYRRAHIPGSSVFLTLITYDRHQLFLAPENIEMLRQACALMMAEKPFKLDAAVILPEHIHFFKINIWAVNITRSVKSLFDRLVK